MSTRKKRTIDFQSVESKIKETLSKRKIDLETQQNLIQNFIKIFLTSQENQKDIILSDKVDFKKYIYIFYTYARICALTDKFDDQTTNWIDECKTKKEFIDEEIALILQISEFNPTIKGCTKNYKIHRLHKYISILSKKFNSYYKQKKIIDKNNPMGKIITVLMKKIYLKYFNLFNLKKIVRI